MTHFEDLAKKDGFGLVIGIDEAGRGPLAGPVVAAAVSLRTYQFSSKIDDSKKLSDLQREVAFIEIAEKADVGIGIINSRVIDEVNILQATFLAMNRAVEDLVERSKTSLPAGKVKLFIDGNRFRTNLPYRYETVVKGDEKVMSIACASIIAKVTRDRILTIYDKVFPQYGFKQHKGYPTAVHRKAIEEHGPSEIHRRSFQLI
jgi:ribonuclease HII